MPETYYARVAGGAVGGRAVADVAREVRATHLLADTLGARPPAPNTLHAYYQRTDRPQPMEAEPPPAPQPAAQQGAGRRRWRPPAQPNMREVMEASMLELLRGFKTAYIRPHGSLQWKYVACPPPDLGGTRLELTEALMTWVRLHCQEPKIVAKLYEEQERPKRVVALDIHANAFAARAGSGAGSPTKPNAWWCGTTR